MDAHEQVFTWAVVKNRIKDLADAGQYLTAEEQTAYPVYLREQESLAERKKLADSVRIFGDTYGSKSSPHQFYKYISRFRLQRTVRPPASS